MEVHSTMAHTIKLKRSETGENVPTGSDLATHEIAMNVSDKRYTQKRVTEQS